MTHVLTLVAGHGETLDARIIDTARALVDADGPDWLSRDLACDLACAPADPHGSELALRDALAGQPVDILLAPAGERRRRVLVADMDSTIVVGETLDELAAEAGLKEKVAAITARAMNGELDFREALRERVGLLEGLGTEALDQVLARTELMPGARSLVRTMAATGAVCWLVSGGFRFFTSRIAVAAGFSADRANELDIADGRLTGRVREPILDKDAKLVALREAADTAGVPLSACMAIGDGANDLPMLQAAGLGVAFRAKPSVAAAAAVRLDHADLTGALYFQGYRRDQIIWD